VELEFGAATEVQFQLRALASHFRIKPRASELGISSNRLFLLCNFFMPSNARARDAEENVGKYGQIGSKFNHLYTNILHAF